MFLLCSMGKNGALTFRDLARRTVLKVQCRRCKRAGAYRLDRLIERYGLDSVLHAWTNEISADCPHRTERLPITERCHGPPVVNLVEILGAREPPPRD